MKQRFYIQLILVAISALLLSSLYYFSICKALQTTKESFPGKLNQIFYDTTAYDAVFVGSSRVMKNIDPLQFDTIAGIHSYNAGIDGANFTLIDFVTRHFIAGHRPSYVFINIDIYTLQQDSSFFYYTQLFPYIHIDSMDRFIKIEPNLILAKYYPFLAVSYIDDYLKGVSFHTLYDKHPLSDATFIHRGFAPIVSADYQGSADEYPLKFIYSEDGFKKLEALCDYCKAMHCKVFFIMAPIYRAREEKPSNACYFYSRLKPIEEKYNIIEFKFFTNTEFSQKVFFNKSHLNENGARMYTKMLADSFIVSIRPNQRSSPAPQVSAVR
jgi:hypothetical protein